MMTAPEEDAEEEHANKLRLCACEIFCCGVRTCPDLGLMQFACLWLAGGGLYLSGFCNSEVAAG